jgi:hypothetical protein
MMNNVDPKAEAPTAFSTSVKLKLVGTVGCLIGALYCSRNGIDAYAGSLFFVAISIAASAVLEFAGKARWFEVSKQ